MSNRRAHVESALALSADKVPHRPLPELAEVSAVAATILAEIAESSEQQPRRRHHTHNKHSKNESWNAHNLIQRFLQPEYATYAARERILWHDAEHFASEFALKNPIRTFQYTIKKQSAQEFSGGYSESVSVILSNFVQMLTADGRPATRALVEKITMDSVFNWLRQLVIQAERADHAELLNNTGILITSPPDTKQAGYAGIDSLKNWSAPEHNHTFFYLCQASAVTAEEITITVTQHQLWPNIQQIIDLHQELKKPLLLSPDNPTSDIYANVIPIELSAITKLLANLPLPLPQDLPLATEPENSLQAAVRMFLFAHASEHTHSYKERPMVALDEFWQYHQQLFAQFYLKQAAPLFVQGVTLAQRGQADTPEYHSVITELDSLFNWFSATEINWVLHYNTNPAYHPEHKYDLRTRLNIAYNKLVHTLNTLLHGRGQQKSQEELLHVATVIDTYQTYQAVRTGRTTTTSDLHNLNQFLGVVGNASGKIQCGSGVMLKVPFQAFNSLAAFEHLAGLHALTTIPLDERKRILTQLNSLEYVELDLRSQGATAVYMVPRSYLEGRGCTVDPATGRVWGPCGPDGARIYLDEEIDTMAYAMTQAEFDTFRQSLAQSITTEELHDVADLVSTQIPEQLHPELQQVLKTLHKYLCKQTVSVIEWLAGDYFRELAANSAWLQQLIQKLRIAPNPFGLLQQEVSQLLAQSPELLLELNNPLPQHLPKAV